MFIEWVNNLNLKLDSRVIAIDGKTSRRTHDGSQRALHLVSAFAAEAKIVLGQVKTAEKSNEITAIPELLELLDITGSIISIDAMGCQKKIAQLIQNKGADYIFSLKGNQSSLHEDIQLFFKDEASLKNGSVYQEIDGGHGRIETRTCSVTQEIQWLHENHTWPGLSSIIQIQSEVEKNGKTTSETRFYITSLEANPKKILESIRSHWAIENSLHWVMDVSFNDDQSRIRKGNAPENMAIMKHVSLNLIRQVKKKRESIKGLRKKAGWSEQTLQGILEQKFR